MAEHSPRPWKLDGRTIRDAEGDVVVSTFSPANMEARRLIVEAVNNYEALIRERRRLIGELDAAKVHADSDARWACEYFKTAQQAEAERDRLRDLVRRLADSLDIAADALWQANIDRRLAITQPEPRSRHLHGVDIDALLREAREALGEGEA